jgi:hypothetical protein
MLFCFILQFSSVTDTILMVTLLNCVSCIKVNHKSDSAQQWRMFCSGLVWSGLFCAVRPPVFGEQKNKCFVVIITQQLHIINISKEPRHSPVIVGGVAVVLNFQAT